MAKIELDKYYTSPILSKCCIDKTFEVLGKGNITHIIEPSAGSGSFSNQLECFACDIKPECEGIIEKDYLELDIPYQKGRLVIGNPPFGNRNTLSVKFFKKSIQIADYIAFILPISQLNNDQQMYEFDLIFSEDLGKQSYSGVELHCCFNIYKRPIDGINKNKRDYALTDVDVREYRRGGTYEKPTNYDFGMCTWGNGSCGKEVEYIGQYAQETYIVINNEAMREKVMTVCRTTDWRHLYPSVSSAKLQTWKIYKHLKEIIPELK